MYFLVHLTKSLDTPAINVGGQTSDRCGNHSDSGNSSSKNTPHVKLVCPSVTRPEPGRKPGWIQTAAVAVQALKLQYVTFRK